jgi:hypothetical protein
MKPTIVIKINTNPAKAKVTEIWLVVVKTAGMIPILLLTRIKQNNVNIREQNFLEFFPAVDNKIPSII